MTTNVIPPCSICRDPLKILNKGPDFFRFASNYQALPANGKRRSARELLEASKSQYVKSISVRESRQQLKDFNAIVTGSPSESPELRRAVPRPRPRRTKTCVDRVLPDGFLPMEGHLAMSRSSEALPLASEMPTISIDDTASPEEPLCTPFGKQQRKDWNDLHAMSRSMLHLPSKESVPRLPHRQLIDPSRRLRNHNFGSASSRTSSDLSDISTRYSRTGSELEKFFDQMGLEPGVLLAENSRDRLEPTEELVESVSVLSIDRHSVWSTTSRESDNQAEQNEDLRRTSLITSSVQEKQHQFSSIIERNARVIKWLCNVRKSRSKSTSD